MAKWQLIESGKYLIDRQLIDANGHDWEEMFSGIMWLLRSDPENVGHSTDVQDIRTIIVTTYEDMPDVMLYYRIERNDHSVRLLTARPMPDDEDELYY